MFRLLIFFVLLGFVILLILSITNIVKNMTNNDQNNFDKLGVDEIEYIIDSIKIKITRAEMDAHSGIEGAEKEVQYWKDQLEQTKKLKERTKNL